MSSMLAPWIRGILKAHQILGHQRRCSAGGSGIPKSGDTCGQLV